ncbi:glycosyltransferase family 25 protein, partial [bacterium]|nr:glycosyltransferase family 25 protein [bacterium]
MTTQQFNELAKDFLAMGTSGSMAAWISFCRNNNLFHLGVSIGTPYLNMFSHNFRFLMELSICYYYVKQYENAFDCSLRLTKLPLNEQQSKSVFANARFCIDHIFRRYEEYPQLVVNSIHSPKLGLVTFTITTCKRIELFKRTMNSFLGCCEDLNRIDRWICVDDNSSVEDREEMQKLYPFFEFVWKTPEDKGHAQSMNILRSMVNTPFFYHMEDDWQYFTKRPYITDCLRVIEQNGRFGQCLINRNYAETSADIDILGGRFCAAEDFRFYVHEFYDKMEEFYKKYGRGMQCGYWPHYSLRPGLSRTKIYSDVGEFKTQVPHFEMEYAYRYTASGYETTFLENIHAIHIGRLTKDRFDKSIDNAYTLNDEKQFVSKDSPVEFTDYDCHVINLKRRPDRLKSFFENAPEGFKTYYAIDGQDIHAESQLYNLFNFNDYNYRRGMVGCALSHIDLWCSIVNNTDDERVPTVIVEDDVTFAHDFHDKCKLLMKDDDWDIIFLGHHIYSRFKTEKVYDPTCTPIKEKWSSIKALTESMGGTGGYIITKCGARKMLQF